MRGTLPLGLVRDTVVANTHVSDGGKVRTHMNRTEGGSPVEAAIALRRMRRLVGELEDIARLKNSGDLSYEESISRSLDALDSTKLERRRSLRPAIKSVRLALGNGWIPDGIRRIREYWPQLSLPPERTGELEYDDGQLGRPGRPPRRRGGGESVGMHVG